MLKIEAMKILSFLFLFICLSQTALGEIYLTPKKALLLMFKGSESVISVKKIVQEKDKKTLEKKLKTPLLRDTWTFYLGKSGKKIDGYALMDHEIGRSEPFTYIVKIDPKGFVEAIEVLTYQETHGSEIRSQRFLKQFKGKNVGSRLKLKQDIKNISGATISAHAITAGVKRSLILWTHFFGG
jgi:Na+-translocating ferredoxin:NAD+ oxidoreductase RnfG subunit